MSQGLRPVSGDGQVESRYHQRRGGRKRALKATEQPLRPVCTWCAAAPCQDVLVKAPRALGSWTGLWPPHPHQRPQDTRAPASGRLPPVVGTPAPQPQEAFLSSGWAPRAACRLRQGQPLRALVAHPGAGSSPCRWLTARQCPGGWSGRSGDRGLPQPVQATRPAGKCLLLILSVQPRGVPTPSRLTSNQLFCLGPHVLWRPA